MQQYQKIKEDFLFSHENHAKLYLANIHHVIIYLNGQLLLLEQQKNGEFKNLEIINSPARGENYNLLKTLSHFSVWLNVILSSLSLDKLTLEEAQEEINSLKKQLLLLQKSRGSGLIPYSTFLEIILKTIEQIPFCDNTEKLKPLQRQFLEKALPFTEDISKKAAFLQLSGLSKIMQHWLIKRQISFEKSRVIIVTTHGPRNKLIEIQFFYELFEKENMKHHVIDLEVLAEHIPEVSTQHLINFLAKQELNRQIGKDMLNDVNGMNSDILGKYAPELLKTINLIHDEAKSNNTSGCPFKS